MGRCRAHRLSARALRFGASLAALGSGACASYGSHLAAAPLPKGDSELSLAADALVIDRGFGPQLLPNPELGLRWGVAKGVDVGGRLNAGSLEGNARLRWARFGRLQLTAVPGVGFGFVPVTNADVGLFNLNAFGSLLAGLDVTRRSQLVLGARGIARYAFPLTTFRGDASEAKVLYRAGGVLGVRFPVGESTFLFPDINVFAPYDGELREWGSPTVQGGLALQFE